MRLSGATVGSNLECDSGSFDNPGGDALVAVGVIVKGSIFLRNGFSAKGEVRLFGATVGTNLECERASLDNADGNALVAEGINVKGHILLRNGFSAKGEVRLPGVTVGSVLALTGRFAGRLNLTDAHAVRLDLTGQTANWPAKGMLLLDGFTYREINRLDERQYLDWLRRLAPAAFHPQPYEQLSRVLRRSGCDKEARAIGIARYKDERPHLGFWARLWSRVRGAVVAYGYRPQQALLWTALLWLSGFLVFWRADRPSLMDHYRGSGCAGRQLHRALLSFDLTLPASFLGLDLHQKSCFAPFYPDAVGLLHGLNVDWLRLALWFWYILQAIAGPVLFVFLSAALAGLIQRPAVTSDGSPLWVEPGCAGHRRKVGYRRVSPNKVRPGKRRLTEPTAAAQPG